MYVRQLTVKHAAAGGMVQFTCAGGTSEWGTIQLTCVGGTSAIQLTCVGDLWGQLTLEQEWYSSHEQVAVVQFICTVHMCSYMYMYVQEQQYSSHVYVDMWDNCNTVQVACMQGIDSEATAGGRVLWLTIEQYSSYVEIPYRKYCANWNRYNPCDNFLFKFSRKSSSCLVCSTNLILILLPMQMCLSRKLDTLSYPAFFLFRKDHFIQLALAASFLVTQFPLRVCMHVYITVLCAGRICLTSSGN